MTTPEREKFEKWAAIEGYKVDWSNDGYYKYSLTNQAWGFWQARQPEIDALNQKIQELAIDGLNQEGVIDALKASVAASQEFTTWWQRFQMEHGGWRFTAEEVALAAFNAHKPEIEGLKIVADTTGDICKLLRKESAALKAELERLREGSAWAVKQHQKSGGLVGLAMESLRKTLTAMADKGE